MAEFTAGPDDIADAAAHIGRDADALRALMPTLVAAGSDATTGVATGHAGLLAAVEEFEHVQSIVLVALADAAEVLTDGFAGAAEDYRDVEIRHAAMLRRAVVA